VLAVQHTDPTVRAHRQAIAQRVLDYFGDILPSSRLLCFLDDNDFGRIRGERGRYQPIHDVTPLAHLPEYVTGQMFIDDERFLYHQRVVDDLVYLCETACANEVGLTMTLAHELQHAIQHSRMRDLWAVNGLIHRLPESTINALKLIWPNIPIECEARIVAKRVAVDFFGEQRVTEYIDTRIRENASASDFADWQFVRTLTPESSIDLVEATNKIYRRLRDYSSELDAVLQEYRQWNPEDFSDIDLGVYLHAATNHESANRTTHFAEIAYHGDSTILALPADHLWVCNASLPSWPSVLPMWYGLCLRTIYCVQFARKFGFREPPMRTVIEEIGRASTFCQLLEDLVVQKESVTIGPGQNRDKLLLAYWSVAFDLDKSILALLQFKFYAGAFGLLRSLIETQLRAHIVVMGSGADVSLIATDLYNVNFETIGGQIDKWFGLQGYMEGFLNRARKTLHSFTHSGLSQLGRRFQGNDLVADYDDEELIELIHVAAYSVFLITAIVTKYFNFEDEWKRTNELLLEWGKPH
jgi:hypothetical protein